MRRRSKTRADPAGFPRGTMSDEAVRCEARPDARRAPRGRATACAPGSPRRRRRPARRSGSGARAVRAAEAVRAAARSICGNTSVSDAAANTREPLTAAGVAAGRARAPTRAARSDARLILDHHRRRLHERRRRHPRPQPELLGASRVITATMRDGSVDDDLDLREQAVHLTSCDDAGEAVARARESCGARRGRVDLGGGDEAAVGGVALDADPSRPVPAPKRVEADPEQTRGVARRVGLLGHRHPQYGASSSVARSTSTESGSGAAIGAPPASAARAPTWVASLAARRATSARRAGAATVANASM